jgi:hypothetical protein
MQWTFKMFQKVVSTKTSPYWAINPQHKFGRKRCANATKQGEEIIGTGKMNVKFHIHAQFLKAIMTFESLLSAHSNLECIQRREEIKCGKLSQ